MLKRLSSILFHLCFTVGLQQCLSFAAPHAIDLPKSSIRLPWSVFSQLSDCTPDTVFIPPKMNPPTAITFGDIHLSAVLHDTVAELSLSVGYTVLIDEGWPEIQIFDQDFTGAVSSFSLPDGDFLRATDTGYILTADAARKNKLRHLSINISVPVQSDAGDVSVRITLPHAVRCQLEIIAPLLFEEISVHNALLSGKQRISNKMRYYFLINAAEGTIHISYKIPVIKIPGDTVVVPDSQSATITREPVITAQQESMLFPTSENAFVYTALHLTVIRTPITRFSIELPDSFSLLTLSGNGIQSWNKSDQNRILEVNLGFALEGNYSIYIAGEQPADSQVVIPAIRVREAAHQTGTFGLVIEKGSEAILLSANNYTDIPCNEYLYGLSSGYSDSISRYGHSLQDLTLAGKYCKIPFSATFLIRRHVPVPVADALCDAGSVRTVISIDAKVLTQANFLIRYRGRQFISLSLPDSVNLWSITLDGVTVSPSKDDDERYKISLQRNYTVAGDNRVSMLEVTYLQTMESARSNRSFNLQAPIADIPISKLDWTIFYPEQWLVRNTDGTFTTTQTTFFGKRLFSLEHNEQQSLYRTLQKSNTAQQTTAKAASALSLMPDSPKHLYAYTILVVNEQPWIEIRFGSYALHRIIIIFCCIVFIISGAIIYRRKMTKQKISPISSAPLYHDPESKVSG